VLFPQLFPLRRVFDEFLFGFLNAAERAFGKGAGRQALPASCAKAIEQANEKQTNSQWLNGIHARLATPQTNTTIGAAQTAKYAESRMTAPAEARPPFFLFFFQARRETIG